MANEVVKRPGADWDIYYIYLDGERYCMSVFGSATPEDAIKEARYSLNVSAETGEEKDQFEILAVVRQGAGIDVKIGVGSHRTFP